ncbi:hypothetical protein OH738_00630 [Streptomyces hirsutus]|uniref:hypothetical protein n=1 Tax=Streptomyces hirsutus TaxID=35620 RepID=UPI00386D3A6E|nr:hypothetical protein OH738_00630 [Streptomyces hirsutus]
MNDIRKIMVLGAGDLGRRVLHDLAHSPHPRRVQLLGRNAEVTLRAVNLARFSSMQRGHRTEVGHALTDLTDVARTAERIAAFQPDVLFLAVSYQPWWHITTLPEAAFQRLYAANYGPWLPMHLVPTMKAMEALRMAGSAAVVVNAAYPDAVHPVLAAAGLSPHIGIGNVANNVPGIRASAADQLGMDVAEIDALLVAHHYVSHRLSRRGDSGPAAMALAVLHQGQDITGKLDVPEVLRRLPADYRRTGGLAGQAMTAASALSVLEPLADGRDALVHAPGPDGLVGGYPVLLSEGRTRLVLPGGMSREEAVAVNLSGQWHDGIAEIRPDGTVVFEESSMRVLTDEFGYDCRTMPLSEAEDRATEITERYTRYRARVTDSTGAAR